MSKERENIPQADTLMGSMRSMGYSFETALADVVDNSISANATTIRILFPTNPMEKLAVGILDDGVGMSDNDLYEAMRYGSTSSEIVRDINDLGRFGLGLKSASLSPLALVKVLFTAIENWQTFLPAGVDLSSGSLVNLPINIALFILISLFI